MLLLLCGDCLARGQAQAGLASWESGWEWELLGRPSSWHLWLWWLWSRQEKDWRRQHRFLRGYTLGSRAVKAYPRHPISLTIIPTSASRPPTARSVNTKRTQLRCVCVVCVRAVPWSCAELPCLAIVLGGLTRTQIAPGGIFLKTAGSSKMPNGRPPKRSGQGVVEPPLDSPSGSSKSKLPRLERPPEDFSSVVKSKLQSYTRTGQACDRCKVR